MKHNWKKEISNYSDKKIYIVDGKKWEDDYDYYIINYDLIKNFHSLDKDDKLIDKKILKTNFDLAIIDEAHYLSNTTANRTSLINDILENIPKVWLLTGTPITSRPINYYNLLKIVKSPITDNWQMYVKRYCNGYQFKRGNRKIWNTNGASHLDELREVTQNLVLRRMKEDIMELPDKMISEVFLELNSEMYDEELDQFLKITKERKHEDTLSVTINRLMKLRQLIAFEKLNYTYELIDKCLSEDKKVVVLTNFTMTLDLIHEKYKKNSVILDGKMSSRKRQESVDKFQNDKNINVFIGNIKAAGVGITLTAGEVVIMNDLSFVPSDHLQGEDRCHRYGQKNNVIVYYPIFENTIEQIVFNILQRKKNIIDQVMGDGEYSKTFAEELITQII